MSFVVEIPSIFTKPTQIPNRLGNTILTGSETIQGNLLVNGSFTLNQGNDQNSSAGILSGSIQNYWVERNSDTSVGDKLSWGDGTTTLDGIHMPFSGKILYATASTLTATGSATFKILKNGLYESTQALNVTSVNLNPILDLRTDTPYSFNAGDKITWKTTAYSATVSGIIIGFWVVFD